MRLKTYKFGLAVVIALLAFTSRAMAIRDDSGFDTGKLQATEVSVDTSNFSKNLGSSDTNAQHAFETLDQMTGGGGSMVYPGAGIPISTGSAWGTSVANNSSNWNTAYGWGNHASAGYELSSNKVTTISSGSTDTQYPSAKLLYDQLATKLATGGTAADSAKLNGQSASYYQTAATNLGSLAGLTFAAASFVKMTSTGTFGLDTTTYVTGTPWTGLGYLTAVAGAQLDNVWSSNGILTRTGTATYGTITDNHTNWDSAYGWGNHASAGYLTSLTTSTPTNLIGFIKGNGSVLSADNSTYLTAEVDPTIVAQTNGFTITRGTTPATLTVAASGSVSGTNTGDGAANSSSTYIGTTQVALNRTSGALSLTGVNIDGSAGTATSATSAGKSTNLVGGNNTTQLGSIPYQSNTDTTLLINNTTTTKKFLRETGDGTNGGVPAFDTVTKTDVGLSNVDNTSDASKNIGGSSATCTGNAGTVTNGVYTTGNQSIAGIKTLSDATEASSATVGGTIISGGLAVAKRVYATDMTVTNPIVGSLAKRVTTASNATSITPNSDTADITYQANTQAAGTLTINADGGNPVNGRSWLLKIKSTNVQTFAWNAQFVGGTYALPISTTGGGKIDYYAFIYDSVNSKWQNTGIGGGF